MNAIKNPCRIILLLALAISFFRAAPALAGGPDDSSALAGVRSAKIIFDVNLHSIKPLPVYLMVIKKTFLSLKAAGLKPDFVVAFRGQSVKFVLKSAKGKRYAKTRAKVAKQIKELSRIGVRFEACNLAMGLLKIDYKMVLSEVKAVGNTFISLMGYQTKGYALILVM